MFRYPLCPGILCVQVSLVFKYPLCSSIPCVQVSLVFRYPLCSSIPCVQVTLVSVERELSSIESTGTCANVSRGDSVAIALKSVIIGQ